MEKQYAWQTDVLKIEKNNRETSQKQALISVEIYTSTHFMLYNAGKYLK